MRLNSHRRAPADAKGKFSAVEYTNNFERYGSQLSSSNPTEAPTGRPSHSREILIIII